MNYHKCTTPGCTRSTYHPNQRICLECEAARLDAERAMIETEKSLRAGLIYSDSDVDELFEEDEE